MNELIAELRRIRVLRDISLRAMSQRIGVDFSAIARWERGETQPAYSTLVQWAAAPDVRVELLAMPSSEIDGTAERPARPAIASLLRVVLESSDHLTDEQAEAFSSLIAATRNRQPP